MNRVDKPSLNDWLKLGGLVLAIAIAAFDVIIVRARNKTLCNNLEKQMIEMGMAVKTAERRASEEIERAKRLVKDAEKRMSETRQKYEEHEKEFRERADAQQVAHRKALEEQKGLYEKRMREMHEEFNRRMNNANARTAEMIENLTEQYNANRKARDSAGDNLKDSAERQHEDAAENQLKMSRSERVARLKANQDEIERLMKANPGCVLVPSDKQARILETRFVTSAQRRYCNKDHITYVREHFRCTNCNRDRIRLGSGGCTCCEVSAERRYALWSGKRIDADKTVEINARIDELRKENAELKKRRGSD